MTKKPKIPDHPPQTPEEDIALEQFLAAVLSAGVDPDATLDELTPKEVASWKQRSAKLVAELKARFLEPPPNK